ncbi:MAG: zinc-ribbon domain-containing protein [Methanoregulaceae archaeon]|nr:MAG: zinc-ribbon domain-containing protein [Methanoregulaceae archaeon]
MPFCTTCGKEVTPGKKFCEYCGTPLEQSAAASTMPATSPAVSAAPASPPVVPVKPGARSGKTTVVAGIIVVLVIIAGIYVIGLPMVSGSPGKGSTPQQVTPFPTQIPTVQPTTYLPITTLSPVVTSIPSGSETYEEKYTQTYKEVLSINRPFAGGQKELFTQDLTTPPLYIKFNITPTIEVGEKIDEVGHTVSTSYISPYSWFKVMIYDAGNGALIEEQGFNKGFSVTTRQEFMVRSPGAYRVEMSGNDVIAEVHILTG